MAVSSDIRNIKLKKEVLLGFWLSSWDNSQRRILILNSSLNQNNNWSFAYTEVGVLVVLMMAVGRYQSCSINPNQPVVIDQLTLLKAGAQADQ